MSRSAAACRAGRGVAAIVALLLSIPAGAVTDEEIFRDFRFNFINPGGRSLGMGGAFISIADDATAAQANPAGLTNLFEPQFFSEIRYADPDSTTTTNSFRDPFAPGPAEEGFDILVRTNPSTQLNPTFISYVHPVGRFVLAFSRQEVIHTTNDTRNRLDLFLPSGRETRDGEGRIDLLLSNFNLSAGFTASDRLALGATLSFGRLELASSIVNADLTGPPIEVYRTEADDEDTDWTLSLGLQWCIAGSVRAGFVFRQGGDFSVDETLTAQPIDPGTVPGQVAERVFFNAAGRLPVSGDNAFTFSNEFHIPDVWGVGLSGQPIEGLTLSLDAVRIEYSDLLDGFDSRLNVLTFAFQQEEQARFTVDDRTNLHFGVEYLIAGASGTTWAARAGFHQDRDNRIRSDFAAGGFGLDSNDNFPGREDVDHWSLGMGVVVGARFQVDMAGDFSDTGTELVGSIIYSF